MKYRQRQSNLSFFMKKDRNLQKQNGIVLTFEIWHGRRIHMCPKIKDLFIHPANKDLFILFGSQLYLARR